MARDGIYRFSNARFALDTGVTMVPESHADGPIYQHFPLRLTAMSLHATAWEIMGAELECSFYSPGGCHL